MGAALQGLQGRRSCMNRRAALRAGPAPFAKSSCKYVAAKGLVTVTAHSSAILHASLRLRLSVAAGKARVFPPICSRKPFPAIRDRRKKDQ